ncbi:pirin family protein [Rhodococcus rhodnii]|uniref:pirin family protein n=1 Tax=Rhodococcus rhodnii TaxID=38312 RepID=UPI0005928F2C|nr:pirin family protein [Rhodococcus rhodnii]
MSNLELDPPERVCEREAEPAPDAVEIIGSRDVPLGGPRAMTVRRTLPSRERSFVGAWCFADHYGPDDVSVTGGMDVAPHPHTGLQTVSWLFTGEIEHRDSMGSHAMVRPGEVNLMTGGHGIAHTEVSTPDTTTLHGVQLWVALPAESRDAPRAFDHHVPDVVTVAGGSVRVFIGSLRFAGEVVASPIDTFTPLLGAEIVVDAGATLTLDVDPAFEHAVLVDTGAVTVSGSRVDRGELGFRGPGGDTLAITDATGSGARVVLLGGTPFDEEIVMWWNFIGRTHEEIVAFRDAWERADDRFGAVEGYPGDRLPAPALPGVRLKPRRNPNR